MKINSKLLFSILIIFGIVNLLDVITAMFILPGESNPIYLLTHSTAALWIFKIIAISLVFYVYFTNEYPSRFWLFSYIYILVIGILAVGIGVYSNILGILNPTIIQTASELSTTQKVTYYGYMVSIIMIIPYIISMVSFKIYEICEKKINYKTKK